MTVPQPDHHPDPQPRQLVEDEHELPPLRIGVRVLLFALGALLVLFGIIFGPLPGIPAIVLVPAGVALLSLASKRLNQRLRAFVIRRWPNAWHRIQRVRAWLHRRLS
ncbi:MAG: hypothetical protein OXH70_04930 [Acidobacteria bacterium]|nr:hypothetical protein [Acidobacteriota bacterium]